MIELKTLSTHTNTMSNTTTIDLVFTIIRDGRGPCTQADLARLDAHLNDDGDALSLEGGRFILDDVRWSTPDLFNGRLLVQFEVEVEPYDGDDIDPAGLAAEVYDAAILLLPEGLDVSRLEVTPA